MSRFVVHGPQTLDLVDIGDQIYISGRIKVLVPAYTTVRHHGKYDVVVQRKLTWKLTTSPYL